MVPEHVNLVVLHIDDVVEHVCKAAFLDSRILCAKLLKERCRMS